MKRVLSLLILLALLLSCLGASFAEEAEISVVVKNYKEFLAAVNEKGATRVLISAKYKHGTTEGTNLKPAGRTVLVVPENGESAVINGRVDVYGEGAVIFENVSIVGPAGDFGLWVGYGANVTAGSVTGGKAKKENGQAAVVVNRATLTIDSAVGSDGKGGFGGDGVYAYGSDASVQIREAVGGSAPKGFGGSGVVVFGGAKVTVTGSATGGNGLYTPGKGVLVGLNGTADGEGTLTDGTELDGKKTLDLEAVANRNMLENALRSGKTDILLTPGYKTGSDFHEGIYFFCAGADPVRIASANEKKPATMDGSLYFATGNWSLDNIKFTLNSGKKTLMCLRILGDANVTASGSVTTKGNAIGIGVQENARIEFTGDCVSAGNGLYANGSGVIVMNGNVTVKSKTFFAVGTKDNATITLNGNVDVAGDSNALDANGGTITMTGTVHVKGSDQYPAVFAAGGGEISLTGPVNNDGKSACITCRGGNVTVNGDVTGKTSTRYPVFMEEDAGDVTINGTLYACGPAFKVLHGNLTVNGDVVIRTRKNWNSFSTTTLPGTSTVTGEFKVEK